MNLFECFICGFKPKRSFRFLKNVNKRNGREEGENSELIKLNNEPHVKFILTEVLELSSRQLRTRSRDQQKGGRPSPGSSGTINLCEACNEDVERIQGIYEVLLEVTKKYNEAKETIQEILRTKRRSSSSDSDAVQGKLKLKLTILKKNDVDGSHHRAIMPIHRGKRKLSPIRRRRSSLPKPRLKITCIKVPESSEVVIKQEKENAAEEQETDESQEDVQLTESLNEAEPQPESVLGIEDKNDDKDDHFDPPLESNPDPDCKLESSTSTPKISCSLCPKKFNTAHKLKCHRRQKHNLDHFKCRWCEKSFLTRKSFQEHRKNGHKDGYPCPHCPEMTFRLPQSLNRHIKIYHEGRQFICKVCGKGFADKLPLENHLFRCHNIGQGKKRSKRLYHCPKEGCSKVLTRKQAFRAHVARHEGKPAPYQCAVCPKNFFTKNNLQIHETLVHKMEPSDGALRHLQKCERCGKAFAGRKRMEQHLRACGKVDDIIKCDLCDISFKKIDDLRTHKKFKHPEIALEEPDPVSNEKEKSFQCFECGKYFTLKSTLDKHIKITHRNEAIHKCSICGVQKWNKVAVDKHLYQEHGIGEPRFHCESCGKTFWHMSLKKRHVCNGILPPSLKISACEICGKEFRHPTNKVRHVLGVHKNEMPAEIK